MITRTEAFDLWLKQLRHPDSLKHKGKLENPENRNERCCLGHLCHALGVESDTDNGYVRYLESVGTLPDAVASTLNITNVGDVRPSIQYGDGMYHSLGLLNDNTDIDSAGIADVIEEVLATDRFVPYGALRP